MRARLAYCLRSPQCGRSTPKPLRAAQNQHTRGQLAIRMAPAASQAPPRRVAPSSMLPPPPSWTHRATDSARPPLQCAARAHVSTESVHSQESPRHRWREAHPAEWQDSQGRLQWSSKQFTTEPPQTCSNIASDSGSTWRHPRRAKTGSPQTRGHRRAKCPERFASDHAAQVSTHTRLDLQLATHSGAREIVSSG